MEHVIMHHRDRIRGTLFRFDRVIFKGKLPIGQPTDMESGTGGWGLRLAEFKEIALEVPDRLEARADGGRECRSNVPLPGLTRPSNSRG